MRKRTITKIKFNSTGNGMCVINIDNIGLELGNMKKCIEIIQQFVVGSEFFFCFYRTDGINLTKEEWQKYDKIIPEHFQTQGRFKHLTDTIEKKGKVKTISRYLTVGSLPVNDETYELIPWIFHYYLDTTFFCPKIDWETFELSYRNYMDQQVNDYIINGFADFLFTYFDSGDFSVEFNPNLFDKNAVYQEINKILNG